MADELSTLLKVRAVERADIGDLVALINALSEHEGITASMTKAHAEFALFSMQRPLQLQADVAVKGRQMVGFVLSYAGYDTASTSYGMHIADIFVAADMRGVGVGTLLVKAVARRCLEFGGQWCSLTVASENEAAMRFYDSLGMHVPNVSFRTIGANGMGVLLRRNM